MLQAVACAAGPGMVWNMSGHVGVWFSPMRGLSFVLSGDQLTIRLTLVGRDANGSSITHTVSTSIKVRN